MVLSQAMIKSRTGKKISEVKKTARAAILLRRRESETAEYRKRAPPINALAKYQGPARWNKNGKVETSTKTNVCRMMWR